MRRKCEVVTRFEIIEGKSGRFDRSAGARQNARYRFSRGDFGGGSVEHAVEGRGRGALLGRQITVARRLCETVRLPRGRPPRGAGLKPKVSRQAPYHDELLVILLAENRDIRFALN